MPGGSERKGKSLAVPGALAVLASLAAVYAVATSGRDSEAPRRQAPAVVSRDQAPASAVVAPARTRQNQRVAVETAPPGAPASPPAAKPPAAALSPDDSLTTRTFVDRSAGDGSPSVGDVSRLRERDPSVSEAYGFGHAPESSSGQDFRRKE
jgi:hypothetical protein